MVGKHRHARGLSALLFLALLLLSDLASLALGVLLVVLLHGAMEAQTQPRIPAAAHGSSYYSGPEAGAERERRVACFAVAVAAAALEGLLVLLQGGFIFLGRGMERNGKPWKGTKGLVWLAAVVVVHVFTSATEATVLLWVQGWAGVQVLGARKEAAEVVLGAADAAWVFAAVGRVGFVLYAMDMKRERDGGVKTDAGVERESGQVKKRDSEEDTGNVAPRTTKDDVKKTKYHGEMSGDDILRMEHSDQIEGKDESQQKQLIGDGMNYPESDTDAIDPEITSAVQERNSITSTATVEMHDRVKTSYVTVPMKQDEANGERPSPPDYSPTSHGSGVCFGDSSRVSSELDESHIHPLFRKGSRDALLAKGTVQSLRRS